MNQNDDDCRLQFRDSYLALFYKYGTAHKAIPSDISSTLARKLDMLNAAVILNDIRSPPANRLKKLNPPLAHCYSIRVNSQYRLIFIGENGIKNLYLDPHKDV